jgi:hypothetical protein
LALCAEGHGAAGRLAEGLHIVDEALGLVEKNGQRLYEAELYRLRGELLLKQSVSDEAQAEACFRQAGVPGVTAGKFTVSHNCLVIKWLRWPINQCDAAGFAVQYGDIPLSVCSHIQHNVLFFWM